MSTIYVFGAGASREVAGLGQVSLASVFAINNSSHHVGGEIAAYANAATETAAAAGKE
jgi:hypothetical protein